MVPTTSLSSPIQIQALLKKKDFLRNNQFWRIYYKILIGKDLDFSAFLGYALRTLPKKRGIKGRGEERGKGQEKRHTRSVKRKASNMFHAEMGLKLTIGNIIWYSSPSNKLLCKIKMGCNKLRFKKFFKQSPFFWQLALMQILLSRKTVFY